MGNSNVTKENQYRYRFYAVYGYQYPSEIVPEHAMSVMPPRRLREQPCAGDIIFQAIVKHVINPKHNIGITFWYNIFGSEREHIYRDTVDTVILNSNRYEKRAFPVTDISKIKSIKELPIPYHSAMIIPIDHNNLQFLWWVGDKVIREIERCRPNIEEPYSPDTNKVIITEEQREEEAMSTAIGREVNANTKT